MPMITMVPCPVSNLGQAALIFKALGLELKPPEEQTKEGIVLFACPGQDVALELCLISGPIHIEVPDPQVVVSYLEKFKKGCGTIKMIGQDKYAVILPSIHQVLVISREYRTCDTGSF